MGFRVGPWVITLLLLSVLVLAVPPASAVNEQATVNIPWQDHVAIEIALPFGTWAVDWVIRVEQGPDIDVLFLPDEGYDEYLDIYADEFTYIVYGTTLGTSYSDESFQVDLYGTHYVVLDNTEICHVPDEDEMVTVVVTYDITYRLDSTMGGGGGGGSSDDPSTSDMVLGVVCVAVVLGGILLTIVAFIRRQGMAQPTVPPRPVQPPGYAPPGYPPPQYPPGGPPPQYPPGGPPPQAYRTRPPPPPRPQPPPYRQSVYHTEDTTYVIEESPSMSLDTTDYYSEKLAEQNRKRYRPPY